MWRPSLSCLSLIDNIAGTSSNPLYTYLHTQKARILGPHLASRQRKPESAVSIPLNIAHNRWDLQ